MERVPRDGTYIFLAGWVILITGLTFAASAVVSMRVLAASLLVFGLLRAFLPAGAVPVIRSRFFDVASYCALALALAYLSGWADVALRS
ncbi:MAG: DUF3017 domain-containing protein [Ancrocorticia sp.]|uniref:DUF3017 domain-containing protein n=1 Tax=Ancrocorticia sp. TaxID=2593684 RepID=UPI003F8EF5D9